MRKTKMEKRKLLLTGGSDGHARIFVREHSDPSYSMLGSFHNMVWIICCFLFAFNMRCYQNAPVQKVDFLPSGSNKVSFMVM